MVAKRRPPPGRRGPASRRRPSPTTRRRFRQEPALVPVSFPAAPTGDGRAPSSAVPHAPPAIAARTGAPDPGRAYQMLEMDRQRLERLAPDDGRRAPIVGDCLPGIGGLIVTAVTPAPHRQGAQRIRACPATSSRARIAPAQPHRGSTTPHPPDGRHVRAAGRRPGFRVRSSDEPGAPASSRTARAVSAASEMRSSRLCSSTGSSGEASPDRMKAKYRPGIS